MHASSNSVIGQYTERRKWSVMKFLIKVLIYTFTVKEIQPCATFGNYSIQAVPKSLSGTFANISSPVQCRGNATQWNVCYYAFTTDANGSMTDFGVYRANGTVYSLVPGSLFTKFIPRSNASFNCSSFTLARKNQYVVQPGDIIAACVRNSQPGPRGSSRLGIIANVSGASVLHSGDRCISLNNSINWTKGPLALLSNTVLHVSLDINVCAVNNGGCEQNCTNNITSYYCSCYSGNLSANGFNCTTSIIGHTTSLSVTSTSSHLIAAATQLVTVFPTTSSHSTAVLSSGSPILFNNTLSTAAINTSPTNNSTKHSPDTDNRIIGAIAASAAIVILVVVIICVLVIVIVVYRTREKGMTTLSVPTTIGGLDNMIYSGVSMEPLNSKVEASLVYEPLNDNEQSGSQEYLAQSYEVPATSLNIHSACLEKLEGEDVYYNPASSEEGIYTQLDHQRIKRISRHDIQTTALLGSGQFGGVHIGVWNSPKGQCEVAIKTLNLSSTHLAAKIKFLQEAAIMAQFKHPNIIQLYGIVTDGEPVMLVLELAHNKDLRSHICTMKPDPGQIIQPDTPNILLAYSKQVALGMQYLSAKLFVHRDLAARNILVTKRFICKIADFGLSRDLADETYYVSNGGMVPLKWTAPEAVHFMKYSTASDVWSYGCLLYEIWSIGCKPFERISNAEVIEKVDAGWRLPPPPGCPLLIYDMMIQCWNPETRLRPSFRDIYLALCQDENTVLKVPNEALPIHPQARLLGGPLDAGEKMYLDLQKRYI